MTSSDIHYLPWHIENLDDGRIAIVNALKDTVCVSRDKAIRQDERDFKAIVELANGTANRNDMGVAT